jgi:hypothetical protein
MKVPGLKIDEYTSPLIDRISYHVDSKRPLLGPFLLSRVLTLLTKILTKIDNTSGDSRYLIDCVSLSIISAVYLLR